MPNTKHPAEVLADQAAQAADAYDLLGVKRAADMLRRIPALEAERDTLRAEVEALRAAIANFCREQAWAADTWKEQPHIKALFDAARHET